jgi:hypothetical protein
MDRGRLVEPAKSGALTSWRPQLEPDDDERRRAEDDPKSHPSQLFPRRHPGELLLQEFEVVGDSVKVAAA